MIDQGTPLLRPVALFVRTLSIPAKPVKADIEVEPAPEAPPAEPKSFVRQIEACAKQHRGEAEAEETPAPGEVVRKYPESTALDQIVGQRLVLAREMNGMNQLVASRKLGYATSAPLSKVEAGLPAPRWLVPRAARVFGVSTDFLLGLSNYPERDPRSVEQIAILTSVRSLIETNARQLTEAMIVAGQEEVAAAAHAEELCRAVLEVSDALATCRAHPAFDEDVIGGSRLVRMVESAKSMAEVASKYLTRRAGIRVALSEINDLENSAPASKT
jgi:hypothetical protein